MNEPFVAMRSPRIALAPFTYEDITPRYLGWLSDPEVNRYSRRLGTTTTEEDARRYLASLGAEEMILRIDRPGYGHVGNIKYGPIDRANGHADISILIGERSVWGQGIATAAIYLVTRWLFAGGLNRVEAGSANPAFLAAVVKLGWRIEGVQRQRVRVGDSLLDWTLASQLRSEFVVLPALEPVESAASPE